MIDRQRLLSRVIINPAIFNGRPIIRGMRIKVENVLGLLADGVSSEDILDDYPELELEDIQACLAYASAVVANESLELVNVIGVRL